MSGIDFIQDLGLVMLATAAAAWLCQRPGVPVIIGCITAGILMGLHTHSFALAHNPEKIQSLAQIGLGFLIFGVGRNDRSGLSPSRSETLQPGDHRLVLVTSEQANEMAF